jgi:threonine/homoserine/homoserine lactone efflux protein
MLESLCIISIAGLITGIFFSVPAAGPVTILIISNGLKGKLRFCHRLAYGASIADLIYTFIAVYAFSNLYKFYEPYIPYILLIGSLILIILGTRIFRTKIDFNHIDDKEILSDKLRNKGGFRSGLFINFLNPVLFVGWLISSFLIISLLASLGYNTGGLSEQINNNIHKIENEEIAEQIHNRKDILNSIVDEIDIQQENKVLKPMGDSYKYTLFLSLVFALMVAAGSTIWFYFLGNFIVARRSLFKGATINKIINGLGILLITIGVYFLYSSVMDLI